MDRKAREPRTSRALYFLEPGRVDLREEPLRPRKGQVLVRSRLIGISHGTEMLAFRGEIPLGLEADTTLKALEGRLQYPLKYGYVNCGVTEQGKRVFAFHPHQDLFYADPDLLVELPQELSDEQAVFLPNMETALGIVHDAGALYGEWVLVVGLGVVGLLVCEILLRSGLGGVIAVEQHELRRQAVRKIGCQVLPADDPGLPQRIATLTGGRGVDLAIDTSASEAGLQLALDSLAFEGTLVEASWHGSRRVSLDLGSRFHRRRLAIKSSQVSNIGSSLRGRWNKKRRLEVVLELLRAVKPSRYITQRLKLGEAQAAFELIAEHPERTIQVVLEP